MIGFKFGNRSEKKVGQAHAREEAVFKRLLASVALVLVATVSSASLRAAEEPFRSQIGNVTVGPVVGGPMLKVPFITWGGDIVTFHANGGKQTTPNSIFGQLGLKLELTQGDDFPQQVKDYIAGKSPFLRGTFSMIGQASEVIGENPATRGVVFLQLTWSYGGDHFVVRDTIKTANDLKGKTILLQKGGPHVGMLDDILTSARISWDDVKVVWTKDVTGSPDSPSEMFKKNPKYDACFAISPDAAGLCGGLDKVGTGTDDTVKGARVLISSKTLSHSIADVYVCRKDFYDANKEQITRFAYGYMKAYEETLDMKKNKPKDYKALLEMAQDIYTRQVVPKIEDADGMIVDADFVHYSGNVDFFTKTPSLIGFEAMNKRAVELSLSRGFVAKKFDLLPSGLDYKAPIFADLKMKDAAPAPAPSPAGNPPGYTPGEAIAADRVLMSFYIYFDTDGDVFDGEKYAKDFTDVAETLAKFGNAIMVVKGHTDPSLLLQSFVVCGQKKGVLQRTGVRPNFKYTLKGQPFDIANTLEVIKTIESGELDGVADADGYSPRDILNSAKTLSQRRADKVRQALGDFAKSNKWTFDLSALQAAGVGPSAPVVPYPHSEADAKQNRRVEFQLIKIPAEFSKKSPFDF